MLVWLHLVAVFLHIPFGRQRPSKGEKRQFFCNLKIFIIHISHIFHPKSTLKKRKFAESSARLIVSNRRFPSYSVWPPTSLIGRKTIFTPNFLSFFIKMSTITCPKSTLKKFHRKFCLFNCEQPQPSIVFHLAARAAKRWPQNTFLLILHLFPAISSLFLVQNQL